MSFDESTGKRKREAPSLTIIVGLFFGGMAIASVVIFFILTQILDWPPPPPNPAQIQRTDGVRDIVPPREVLDFTLPAHTGEDVSLSDLEGTPTLIFFGYTYCPDVCPLTISDVRQARDLLGEDGVALDYVFIGVDAARDTPQRLNTFFEGYRVADWMLGLSGDPAILDQISVDYGLSYAINEPDENGYYTVDHTANLYLLNADRELVAIFNYGTLPEVIADTIRENL